MSPTDLERKELEALRAAFPQELIATLAGLHDAPAGIAEVVIASLPYGSRRALVVYGLIEPIPAARDAATEIVITAKGRLAIEAGRDLVEPGADVEAEAKLAAARERRRARGA
jgi:hypothetical protein